MDKAPKPQWSWSMPTNFGDKQFSHLDRFVIVDNKTDIAVEGIFNDSGKEAESLNNHELNNGRPARYEVRPVPVKLQNTPPEMWRQLLSEGEEAREQRARKITKLWNEKYPLVKSAFLVMANEDLAKANGAWGAVDWAAIHKLRMDQVTGTDVRDQDSALREILRLSPGAVTHDEQDTLCDAFKAVRNVQLQTNFSVLMSYAHALGQARKSGDPERIEKALAEHDAYVDLVRKSSQMNLNVTTDALHRPAERQRG